MRNRGRGMGEGEGVWGRVRLNACSQWYHQNGFRDRQRFELFGCLTD